MAVASAGIRFISIALSFAFLFSSHRPVISAADAPLLSPSLPPRPPPSHKISPSPATPASSPSLAPSSSSSPPAPPPSDLAPNSPSPAPTKPPSPSPGEDDGHRVTPPPSPAPDVSGGFTPEDQPDADDVEAISESSDGLSGKQKAGIAIGVIAGVCVIGIAVLVCKKRRQNMQRSQYGFAT